MSIRALFSLYFLAIFLQSGTYGLTFLLPPLFADFAGTPAQVGTTLAITAVTTIVTVLMLGLITARLGRMISISVSGLLIALALLLFSTATTAGFQTAIAAGLLGVGWGIFYVLTPVVLTQLVPSDQRVKQFTLLSVFIMAGFGLAPVFGATLVSFGFSMGTTFGVTAGFCVFSGVIFAALKTPVAVNSLAPETSDSTPLSWLQIKRIATTRAIRPIIMVWLGASVFAAVSNYQTVYAGLRGVDYSNFFLAYTLTVVILRIVFARFSGGRAPYGVIALLLGIMTLSLVVLLLQSNSQTLYLLAAILFGIGYGVSYPIIKAMCANDADPDIMAQTLQVFGVAYFVGVFGFPLIAGHLITQFGVEIVLVIAAVFAAIECFLAATRYFFDQRTLLATLEKP